MWVTIHMSPQGRGPRFEAQDARPAAGRANRAPHGSEDPRWPLKRSPFPRVGNSLNSSTSSRSPSASRSSGSPTSKTSSKSSSTSAARPRLALRHDFRFLSETPVTQRRHRARLFAHLAVRRRQPRGHRANAASHQRDPQSPGQDRRPHLPRRPRGVRNDRHYSRRDAQRQVDLLARPSGRRQDDDAARMRAHSFRRSQARRHRRYVERNRRRLATFRIRASASRGACRSPIPRCSMR